MISQYFVGGVVADSASDVQQSVNDYRNPARLRHFDFVETWIRGSSTVVTKKDANLADGVRFNGQEPVSRSGKATGRGAFEVQSAQAISAAYYFDLATRDYILADGAIELVIEGVPRSAFIEPSQSSELIFCDRSDGPRGRKHAADGGKFRRDLQEHSAIKDLHR
jgi:hypothetical protein